ncbi:MAG: V-type ATPase subunit [Thermoplasmatales archaeon]|nr:V-type ATPase subunit [Thermoplasmatales archaeon]
MILELFIAILGISIAISLFPSLFVLAKFSYANAKFSAIEPVFLKEREIERLLGCKNVEEFKNSIVSKDFILYGENAREIQESIDESYLKIIIMAMNDSPKSVRKFYRIWLKRAEIEKLKYAIRKKMGGEEFEVKVFDEEIKEIIEDLKKGEGEKLKNVFNVSLEMPFEEIEREIDKKIINELLELELPRHSRKAKNKFVRIMIDIMNIKAILRGKYYGLIDIEKNIIPHGWELAKWQIERLIKIDSISEIISLMEGTSYYPPLKEAIVDFEREGVTAFERALDKHLINISNLIANENPLAIGPGIRFLIEKEYEVRNLKAIVKGIEEKMAELARRMVIA